MCRCSNESSNAKPDTSDADKMVKNNTNENSEYIHDNSQSREESVRKKCRSLPVDLQQLMERSDVFSRTTRALWKKLHRSSPLYLCTIFVSTWRYTSSGPNFIIRTIDLRKRGTKRSRWYRAVSQRDKVRRRKENTAVKSWLSFQSIGWWTVAFLIIFRVRSDKPVPMCILITLIIQTAMWCALVLVFAMLALARQNKTRAPTTRGTFFSLLYLFWNQASLRHFYRYLNYSLLYRESVFNYKTETALRDHIEINILNNKKGNTCCDEKKNMYVVAENTNKWKMKIYTENLYRWDLNIFFSEENTAYC